MNEETINKQIKILLGDSENKSCFDCYKKNPTYINVTIGSFVCTNCAGKLRNFNFRVKAVGMSSFTENELNLLLKRGNEACRLIYLHSFTKPAEMNIDSHLRDKYTQLYWYRELGKDVERQIMEKNKVLIQSYLETHKKKGPSMGSAPVKPTAGLIISPPPQTLNNQRSIKHQPAVPISNKSHEIIENIFKDAFPSFSVSLSSLPQPSPKNPFKVENRSSLDLSKETSKPAISDRYAALAELDSIFSNSNENQKIGSSGYFSTQSSLQNDPAPLNPFLISSSNTNTVHNDKFSDFNPFEELKRPNGDLEKVTEPIKSINVDGIDLFKKFDESVLGKSKKEPIDPFADLLDFNDKLI